MRNEKNLTYWIQNQYNTIDLLRFPLVIAVIFIHMNPNTLNLNKVTYPLLSYDGISNIVSIAISHVIAQSAVPIFYVISGFLFFTSLQEWSWATYAKKIKRRLYTLVIPYFAWNILVFIIECVKMIAKKQHFSEITSFAIEHNLHILWDYKTMGAIRYDILNNPIQNYGPIDIPLWFLRDLIIVSCLTPIIHRFVKNTKLFGILLLFVAYVTRIWTNIPGFGIPAFLFFSIGAYLSINNINIAQVSRKSMVYIMPLFLILLISCIYYDGRNTNEGSLIFPFFILSSIFTAFSLSSLISERLHCHPNKLLINSCFFIFAAHCAPIFIKWTPLSLSKQIMGKCFSFSPDLSALLTYLTAPFLTLLICFILFYIFYKYLHRFASPFLGNR